MGPNPEQLKAHKKRRRLFMSIDDIRRENLTVKASIRKIAKLIDTKSKPVNCCMCHANMTTNPSGICDNCL